MWMTFGRSLWSAGLSAHWNGTDQWALLAISVVRSAIVSCALYSFRLPGHSASVRVCVCRTALQSKRISCELKWIWRNDLRCDQQRVFFLLLLSRSSKTFVSFRFFSFIFSSHLHNHSTVVCRIARLRFANEHANPLAKCVICSNAIAIWCIVRRCALRAHTTNESFKKNNQTFSVQNTHSHCLKLSSFSFRWNETTPKCVTIFHLAKRPSSRTLSIVCWLIAVACNKVAIWKIKCAFRIESVFPLSFSLWRCLSKSWRLYSKRLSHCWLSIRCGFSLVRALLSNFNRMHDRIGRMCLSLKHSCACAWTFVHVRQRDATKKFNRYLPCVQCTCDIPGIDRARPRGPTIARRAERNGEFDCNPSRNEKLLLAMIALEMVSRSVVSAFPIDELSPCE